MASYQELKSLDLGDLGCRLGQNTTHIANHLKLDGDDLASSNSENLYNYVTPIKHCEVKPMNLLPPLKSRTLKHNLGNSKCRVKLNYFFSESNKPQNLNFDCKVKLSDVLSNKQTNKSNLNFDCKVKLSDVLSNKQTNKSCLTNDKVHMQKPCSLLQMMILLRIEQLVS